VQYGLRALNKGVITAAEFLDLNERIGGYDKDGNIRSERTVADPEAVRLAYAAGRLNSEPAGCRTCRSCSTGPTRTPRVTSTTASATSPFVIG
jgi:hypothetical protein